MNVTSGTRAALVPDIIGSIIASQDLSSGALTKIGYLPYGKSPSAGPFGFTGQRIDVETGGFYYYRARHYSPAWGRFLQVDPLSYAGGSNLYRYARNDPLSLIDRSGLAPEIPQLYTPPASAGISSPDFGPVAPTLTPPADASPSSNSSNNAAPSQSAAPGQNAPSLNVSQATVQPAGNSSTSGAQQPLQLAQNAGNIGTLVSQFKTGNLENIGIYDFGGGFVLVVNVGQRIAPPALAIDSPLAQSGRRLNDN